MSPRLSPSRPPRSVALSLGPLRRAITFSLLIGGTLLQPTPAAAQNTPSEWIQKSNANAQVLLDYLASFSPESAGQYGMTGLDEEIFDLKPRLYERQMEAAHKILAELKSRLVKEQDARVRQDLEILVERVELQMESGELDHRLSLPYFNVHRAIYGGLKGLLDDQVAPARRPAALVRLRRPNNQKSRGLGKRLK